MVGLYVIIVIRVLHLMAKIFTANELTNEVIDYIYRCGGFAWRQNSGGVYDKNIGVFRTSSKKGVSDVLACYKGRIFCIEVKIGKDKLSQEQQGFLKNIENVRGRVYVAQYFDDFKFWFNSKKLEIDNRLDDD